MTILGDTLEDLFVEAARMVGSQCGPTTGDPGPWRTIRVASSDDASLLVDWLNELIGRSVSEQQALGDVRALRIRPGHVTADVRGRPVSDWRSPLKAAIAEGVQLGREGPRWRAEVLFEV